MLLPSVAVTLYPIIPFVITTIIYSTPFSKNLTGVHTWRICVREKGVMASTTTGEERREREGWPYDRVQEGDIRDHRLVGRDRGFGWQTAWAAKRGPA